MTEAAFAEGTAAATIGDVQAPEEHEALADRLRRSPVRLAFDAGSDLPRLLEDIAQTVERRGSCVIEQARALLGGLGIVAPRASHLRATSGGNGSTPDAPADISDSATDSSADRVTHNTTDRAPDTSGHRAEGAATADEAEPVAPAAEAATVPTPPAAAPRSAASADDPGLAIPAYDSLSASQVVPRLASLEPDELDRIRAYEAAGRARRTILNRIDQLRSA